MKTNVSIMKKHRNIRLHLLYQGGVHQAFQAEKMTKSWPFAARSMEGCLNEITRLHETYNFCIFGPRNM